MAEDDDEFAAALIPLLASLPGDDEGTGWSFDGVNEAFGHFVQDSFRNRKEDAQYMTPPEVVAPLVVRTTCRSGVVEVQAYSAQSRR
jgi:hypothetical protein